MDPSDIQQVIEAAVTTALQKQIGVVETALQNQADEHLKQMTDFQITMEDKFAQMSHTLPAAGISVKKEPNPTDDASQSSSASSEVEFIRNYIKPKFSNTDAAVKHSQDRLYRLQSKLESQIPKLAYDKPASGDKVDPSTSFEPPTHNYLKWLKALLKYYKSLSPALADSTEQFLNQLNIDDFIHGRNQIHYPQLDDDDYPDLIKVSAMTAITASVSSDFSHLIDEDTMVDIFPSLVNLHCTCRPNSDDDRANQLISFWDLRQNSTETVSFFGNKLRAASKAFNDASSSGDKISDSQLAAALKNGIKKGAQSERFAHALMTMKYKISNPPFDSMLLWLDQNCDRTKSVDTVSQGQQASAARTRGGARGGKGDKGRGGSTRGGGKGGKSRAVRAEDNGTAVWKQTYYKVEDADGNDTITKEVTDYRSKRPCFTMFEDGKCDEPECPYSHDFNLADRRPASRSTRARVTHEEKASSAAPAAPPVPPTEDKAASSAAAATISTYDSEDDGFQYAYDLGFQSASAACIPTQSLTTISLSLLLLFAPAIISGAHVTLGQTVAALLGDVSPGRLAFLLCSYSLLLLSIFLCPRLSTNFAKAFRYTASSVFWTRGFKAAYQTILDCGCTFTMSGDLSIFDPSSLVPIKESVGLAESGHAVDATHFGKACIGGQFIDALYVPSFKQTMVSMGQLEKMGLVYSVIGNTRNFLTPNNSIFLSFSLSTNNLYILSSSSSTSHSSSSVSA